MQLLGLSSLESNLALKLRTRVYKRMFHILLSNTNTTKKEPSSHIAMPDQTPQDLPCYNHPIRHSGHHIHLSSSALRDTPINGISTFPSPQSRYWTIRVRIVSSYINTMNAYLDELQLQAVVCGQKCCGGGSLITPGLQAWVPLSHPHLTPQNTFFTYKVGCCKFPDQCCPHHGHSSKCHFKPSCNPDSPERIQAVQDVAQEALLYQQLEQRERQRRAVEGRNRLESVSGPIQRAVAEGLG